MMKIDSRGRTFFVGKMEPTCAVYLDSLYQQGWFANAGLPPREGLGVYGAWGGGCAYFVNTMPVLCTVHNNQELLLL